MDSFKEKVERWKATAEIFLKEDKKIFIKDIEGNFYFADVILVGENTIMVQCFAPQQRQGEKITLYWTLISKLDEYREQEE